MAMVTNREELKQYCLRALGAPLVNIDATDEQLEDRIDEAILFFQEYYWDGITKEFLKYQVSATDITNQYIAIPDHIWGVTRVFPASTTSQSQPNIFDLQYQLRMNDLRDLTSTSMQYYSQVMSHLSLLDNLLNVQRQFRFNRLQGKLFLDLDWSKKILEGDWILVEAYAALNPADSPKMWNDRHFKEYTTALFKKQWASPLKKYRGIALPGGITVDGQTLYQEAIDEIKEIETEIMDNLAPLEFTMG